MEKPCLHDPNEYPDDGVLLRYLGDVKTVWDSFLEFLKEEHPGFSTEWRYYNDGKSWLFKVTNKTKTLCWTSVSPNLFKTTCYFGDKEERVILESELPHEFKDQFVNGKRYGKIRGITVEVKTTSDLEVTKILIKIRESLK